MRVTWSNLAEPADGTAAELSGFPLAPDSSRAARTFLIANSRRIHSGSGFSAIAEPVRQGGMAG